MREIEVKARIDEKNKLLEVLKSQGVELSEPLKHHDVVYSRPGAVTAAPDEIWLRVRTENDKTVYFTLKKQVSSQLDSIEHEVTVSSSDEITAIINQLGYVLYSDLTKTRQKAKVGDVEICLDEIPGLGVFIEAEKLCDDNVVGSAVEAELWELLNKFGVTQNDQETNGYDVLVRKQQGLE